MTDDFNDTMYNLRECCECTVGEYNHVEEIMAKMMPAPIPVLHENSAADSLYRTEHKLDLPSVSNEPVRQYSDSYVRTRLSSSLVDPILSVGGQGAAERPLIETVGDLGLFEPLWRY